jgi:membrane-associated phospholipid phosphatase
LGRQPPERDQFLTGWVFTYAISYLGYLFLPAYGPVVYHAGDYELALRGGFFYRTVVAGVEAAGGPHGAFPSLHIGGSMYLCCFDLKSNRLRGLTYLPIVLLIYVATVFLRYHYVVDLIAGTLIAWTCIRLGPWAFSRWVQGRRSAGLVPLPGGEGDDLSSSPGDVSPGTESVLSAD